MAVPKIGRAVGNTPARTDSVIEELSNAPQAEVLGTIKPKGAGITAWTDAELNAQIEIEQGPPPWVVDGVENPSDARNLIRCPDDWVLYWINVRLLDQVGWRGWQHVRAADPRVTILVPAMVTPEGMVRRGGPNGDILSYMPKHWYMEKWKLWEKQVALKTQSSVDRAALLKQEFARGKFPNVQLESVTHPTQTLADLSEVKD